MRNRNIVPHIAQKYMRKFADLDVDSNSTMVAIYPPQEWVDILEQHAHPDIQGTLHTTLVYLGKRSLLEAERAVTLLEHTIKGQHTFPVTLNGAACFCNGDTRVRVVMPNGVELPSVRQRIYDVLQKNHLLDDQTYGFIPHMTLEYHDGPDMPMDWETVGALDLPTWWVDSVQVVRGDIVIGGVSFD